MKILLCLLSDQHVPNLLSVHHFNPDRLVLLESAGMKKRAAAENFLRALEVGNLDYRDRTHVEPLFDENNLDAAHEALECAHAKFPHDQWTANVTGGTKPMSLAAYVFFKPITGARVVYTPINYPTDLLDFGGAAIETCGHRLTIREFVAGYGFECRQPEHALHTKEYYARQRWGLAQMIALQYARKSLCRKPFFECLNTLHGKKMQLKDDYVQCSNDAIRNALCRDFGLKSEGTSLLGTIDRHVAQFLGGGWLEVFMWGLLHKHRDTLGLWDVRLGLVVERLNVSEGQEYDVSFMRDHALCTLECKSGTQTHDPKFDILYKVEATIRQFRALRVRSFIATTSEHIYAQSSANGRKLKPQIVNRADIYNCRILGIEQIQDLAANSEDAERIRATLFG